MTSAGFSSATAKAGGDSGTKYQISINLTSDALKAFSGEIKRIAALDNDKNYIILLANGINIVKVFIKSEHAETGWTTNNISFNVPNYEYQYELTPDELEKALNSGDVLTYVLINVGGGAATTNVIETSVQNVSKIDLLKSLDEGKTLREIFEDTEGYNHYNYLYISGSKCELWVKGDKKKLVQTYSTNNLTGTYYCYGDTLYSYTNSIAVEMPSMIYNYFYDAWEYTRKFFDENESENVEFVNIGSENVNGENCTVFNVTCKNIAVGIIYRTGRIYISNSYGCIVKHVKIFGDQENETLKLVGQSLEVTENTVMEYYGLKAYTLVDSDVNMPAGTQIVKNPMG